MVYYAILAEREKLEKNLLPGSLSGALPRGENLAPVRDPGPLGLARKLHRQIRKAESQSIADRPPLTKADRLPYPYLGGGRAKVSP